MTPDGPRRLAVIGGGIAGLAAAYAARRTSPDRDLSITLFESSATMGGKILTELHGGELYEWGPDSFLASKPEARRLADDLGLDLVAPGPAGRRAYLLIDGRLRPIPPGLVLGVPTRARTLLAAVRDNLLSPLGALRAAIEPALPALPSKDRSVADLARRRLGKEVAERLVGPLLAGVFGTPADELSAAVSFPNNPRSLVLAMRRRPLPDAPPFLAPRKGMGQFVQTLTQRLDKEDLRIGTPAPPIRPAPNARFLIGDEPPFDGVILAVPAPQAANLLEPVSPPATALLRSVATRSAVVFHLRYDDNAFGRPLDAAGFLVAGTRASTEVVTGCSWLNPKWPHLAIDGLRLRVVVSSRAATKLPDDRLIAKVVEEIGRAMDARGDPTQVRLKRLPEAMHVYATGHLDLVTRLRRRLPPGIAIAGALLGGVGIPDCIRTGEEAVHAALSAS